MTDASQPLERLAVTFFEHPVLAAARAAGTIMCALRAHEDLYDRLQRLRVMSAGGPQAQDFLILDCGPAWISSGGRVRASVVVRERLHYLRLVSVRQVYDAVARAANLPEGSSSQIGDLADLERCDQGMRGIAARQQAIEKSQGRARAAWNDHDQHIRLLERRIGAANVGWHTLLITLSG